MAAFSGFSGGTRSVPVPSPLLGPLLEEITDVAELKCTLRFLWHLAQRKGQPRMVRASALLEDDVLLAALGRIMAECPTPVVMLSALTGEQTRATIEALEIGAVDFFLKPAHLRQAGADGFTRDLSSKLKLAAQVNPLRLRARSKPRRPPVKPSLGRPSSSLHRVVTVGSSTGGPHALLELIPALPGDIPAAFLLVQHMPAGFTRSLAKRLDDSSELTVREAEPGDTVRPGLALIAPGGYHMTVSKTGKIGLNQSPSVSGVRPSVDITMESVASAYGKSAVGVVLTGMGSDGTRGAGLIKAAGGKVLVEDQSTCAVYGMPKSIVESGYADSVVPLHEMAGRVVQVCGEEQSTGRRTAIER